MYTLDFQIYKLCVAGTCVQGVICPCDPMRLRKKQKRHWQTCSVITGEEVSGGRVTS